MNNNKISIIATGLTALLALSPAASFAQGTTTFSGETVALKANAVGNLARAGRYRSATIKRREPEHIAR